MKRSCNSISSLSFDYFSFKCEFHNIFLRYLKNGVRSDFEHIFCFFGRNKFRIFFCKKIIFEKSDFFEYQFGKCGAILQPENNKILEVKMKRFVLMGVISSILLASCNGVQEFPDGEGLLLFSFAQPLKSVVTKSAALPDTNAFILQIVSNSGDTLYNGSYSRRPKEMKVQSGTYDISVISNHFDYPQFEMPQYGDKKLVVVSNGEKVVVSFLCKQINSGIKISFSDNFRTKFGESTLLLRQECGELDYPYSENRAAYFKSGNVEFAMKSSDSISSLFNRVLSQGELHSLTLDASSNQSDSEITIKLDTTVTRISERIIVGDDFSGDNGLSWDKAMSLTAARSRVGDTLWVWGYVVGGDISKGKVSFSSPFESSAHIAIATSPTESVSENCFSVQLSKTAIKQALNLVDNPGLLRKKIFVLGKVDSAYLGLAGVRYVSDYKIE